MPEQGFGEKTEEPTPRRRQEARDRGQVPKSADLNAALLLLAALMVLGIAGRGMLGKLKAFMLACFESAFTVEMTLQNVPVLARDVVTVLLGVMAPLIGVLVVMAIVSNIVQSGVLVTAQPLKPKFDKMNPINGLQRIFSRRGLMKLVVNVVKMLIMATIIVVTIREESQALSNAPLAEYEGAVSYGFSAVFTLSIRMAVALLILGILDYGWQYYSHEQELKMTKQEVRDELKRMEGDPLVRDRRRRMQREAAAHRMMQEVPQATVVITNPTHYSVALRYEPDMSAPQCVAKGVDHNAMRIRAIAEEHAIPLVERPPLARALYAAVEPGQEVPAQYYKAVAEVLAYVYELNRRMEGVGGGV